MSEEDIHTLSGAYAIDAVDDVERARFERHLASCESCRTEVAELREVAAALADLTEVTPPPQLRGQVLDAIATVRPLPPAVPRPLDTTTERPGEPAVADLQPPASGDRTRAGDASQRPGRGRHAQPVRRRLLAGIAAAIVLLGGGALAVTRPWEQQAKPPTVAEQVEQAPDAQRASASVGSATATVVRSASLDRAVLITDNMPAAPSGKTYQAWLQAPDGSLSPAGLMSGGSAQTLVLQGAAKDATGVGITVEPAGGSKQPTTKPVALIPLT